MKKFIGYGDFYCPLCGERLNSGSDICPGCGAEQGSRQLYKKWPLVACTEREKKRRIFRYRSKEVIYKLLVGVLLAFGVPAIMFAIGELQHDKEGELVATFLRYMFIGIAILYSVVGVVKKRPIYKPAWLGAGQTACSVCGRANDERSAYCTKCGCVLREVTEQVGSQAKANAGAFCPSCGSSTAADAVFCESCGTRI